MKVIYLPKFNIALVFFFKSGSTLLVNFFIKFLAYSGVKMEKMELNRLYTDYRNCKIYIFVRNPIERLISIFYDRFNDAKTLYPINDFKHFLERYNQFCQTNTDPHFFPQLYNIMVADDLYWNGVCDLGHYLNSDHTKVIPEDINYKIVKIEEFGDGMNRVLGMFQHINDVTNDWDLFSDKDIKHIDVIEELGNIIGERGKTYGYVLYDFMVKHFDKTHHSNLSPKFYNLLKREENKEVFDILLSLTSKEADFYGYDINA